MNHRVRPRATRTRGQREFTFAHRRPTGTPLDNRVLPRDRVGREDARPPARLRRDGVAGGR
eukprot:3563188-Alexandrium_andersonii.AAC.1